MTLKGLADSPYLKCGNFVLECGNNDQKQILSIRLNVKFLVADTPYCLRVEV